ncbi:MAG: tetratricopeptide repeat protein [Blastocatellia bacterium]
MSVNCNSCGSELSQQVKFCPRCGAIVSQVSAPDTVIENTEPLFAAETEIVQQRTEALTPDTEELPAETAATGKIPPPATAALNPQKEVATKQAAASQPKPGSPMKLAAFAAFFLLAAVAAVSIYYAGQSPSGSTPDPSPTPVAALEPTPIETPQPVSTPTPVETPTPTPDEITEKAPEKVGEITESKPKSTSDKPGAISTGKGAPKPTPSAAEHKAKGMNAASPAQALVEYKQALRLDPTDKDVYYLMGLAYEKLGQLREALESHRKCTSINYQLISAQHVKRLEKELKKPKR